MDLEAPADAWYVFLAVALVSVALAGLIVNVTTGPPPDAKTAANAIEGATGSTYESSSSYAYDADVVTVDRRTITMENDHGTSHASFSYGTVVVVNGYDDLEAIAYGESFEEVFEDELKNPHVDASTIFFELVDAADVENSGEPLTAGGELQARTVAIEEDATIGVEAKTTNADELQRQLASKSDEIEEDDVEIPGQLRLRTQGEPGAADVGFDAATITDTIDVEDSDGWFQEAATDVACSIFGWWCDDVPTVEATDTAFESFESIGGSGETVVTFVEEDLEEVLDTDDDHVEIWAGTYDLEVTISGKDFDDCSGRISDEGEWVTLCAPEVTLDAFDDPHWHRNHGGVHYVTLVVV